MGKTPRSGCEDGRKPGTCRVDDSCIRVLEGDAAKASDPGDHPNGVAQQLWKADFHFRAGVHEKGHVQVVQVMTPVAEYLAERFVAAGEETVDRFREGAP